MSDSVLKEFMGKYVYIETIDKITVNAISSTKGLYYVGKVMSYDANYIKLRPCISRVLSVENKVLFAELTAQEQNGNKTKLINHSSVLSIEELIKS